MDDQSKMTEGEAATSAMAGKVEPPEPTREERAGALFAQFEHAHKHNAPLTPPMIQELKVLLLNADETPAREMAEQSAV